MPVSTIQNASLASGVPSSAKLPAGSVLQVVNAIYSTETTNSTSTYADTGLSATITPTSATSKILILINHVSNAKSSASALNDIAMQLMRNGSSISVFARGQLFTGTALTNYGGISYTYLDSPSTTSATTYKTQFKNDDNNGPTVSVQTQNTPATITLLEIAQ
jgi:hypothetical protein